MVRRGGRSQHAHNSQQASGCHPRDAQACVRDRRFGELRALHAARCDRAPPWLVAGVRREYPADPDAYELLEDCGRGVSATVRGRSDARRRPSSGSSRRGALHAPPVHFRPHPTAWCPAPTLASVPPWRGQHNFMTRARAKPPPHTRTTHTPGWAPGMQVHRALCKTHNNEPVAVKKMNLDTLALKLVRSCQGAAGPSSPRPPATPSQAGGRHGGLHASWPRPCRPLVVAACARLACPRPRSETTPPSSLQEDIIQETQTMKAYNHPNVLPLYTSFVAGTALYMITPFMSGGSILHIMKYGYPEVRIGVRTHAHTHATWRQGGRQELAWHLPGSQGTGAGASISGAASRHPPPPPCRPPGPGGGGHCHHHARGAQGPGVCAQEWRHPPRHQGGASCRPLVGAWAGGEGGGGGSSGPVQRVRSRWWLPADSLICWPCCWAGPCRRATS